MSLGVVVYPFIHAIMLLSNHPELWEHVSRLNKDTIRSQLLINDTSLRFASPNTLESQVKTEYERRINDSVSTIHSLLVDNGFPITEDPYQSNYAESLLIIVSNHMKNLWFSIKNNPWISSFSISSLSALSYKLFQVTENEKKLVEIDDIIKKLEQEYALDDYFTATPWTSSVSLYEFKTPAATYVTEAVNTSDVKPKSADIHKRRPASTKKFKTKTSKKSPPKVEQQPSSPLEIEKCLFLSSAEKSREIRSVAQINGREGEFIFISIPHEDWDNEFPDKAMIKGAKQALYKGFRSNYTAEGIISCGKNLYKLKTKGSFVNDKRGLLGTISPIAMKTMPDGTKIRYLTLHYSKHNQKKWH